MIDYQDLCDALMRYKRRESGPTANASDSLNRIEDDQVVRINTSEVEIDSVVDEIELDEDYRRNSTSDDDGYPARDISSTPGGNRDTETTVVSDDVEQTN